MLIPIIIVAVVVIILIWLVATRNSLVGLSNQVDEAFSTMDVYLKKRCSGSSPRATTPPRRRLLISAQRSKAKIKSIRR